MFLTTSIVLAAQTFLVTQGGADTRVEREAWVMGTRLRVVAEAPDARRAEKASELVLAEIERLDGLLSTWSSGTEVSRLNGSPVGEPVTLSPELMALLMESRRWEAATGGAFRPGVGPLIEAWDLRGRGRVPEDGPLRRARAASGRDAWSLDPARRSVVRHDTLAWIDTGAFGKGAALRSAEWLLKDRDPRDVRLLVDLGGQVWARAEEHRPWRVPVASPDQRDVPAAWLLLHDVSAATSGTSERWVEVEGERYGHILDPRSGHPAPAWGTVTVVHADAFVADVLSTALHVMGPEEGPRWLASYPEVAALFLESREDGVHPVWTPAMERWLEVPPSKSPSPRCSGTQAPSGRRFH